LETSTIQKRILQISTDLKVVRELNIVEEQSHTASPTHEQRQIQSPQQQLITSLPPPPHLQTPDLPLENTSNKTPPSSIGMNSKNGSHTSTCDNKENKRHTPQQNQNRRNKCPPESTKTNPPATKKTESKTSHT
jgi:hypothetical protein